MTVYGFDSTDIWRGELAAVAIEASHFDLIDVEGVAAWCEWEQAFTRFREARRALLQRMDEAGTDDDAMRLVRSMRARDIPIDVCE